MKKKTKIPKLTNYSNKKLRKNGDNEQMIKLKQLSRKQQNEIQKVIED